jgi:hypothetical protein
VTAVKERSVVQMQCVTNKMALHSAYAGLSIMETHTWHVTPSASLTLIVR